MGREQRVIEMLEGVPGSGKSYYAVSERLLKWVRAGRRVYVFVDGSIWIGSRCSKGSSWQS